MRRLGKVGCIFTVICSGCLSAQENTMPTYNIGLGLVYEENAGRGEVSSDVAEESDVRRVVNAGIGIQDNSKHMSYRAFYSATDTVYSNNTFGDRTSVSGIGELRFFTATQTLGWTFFNTQTDTIVDVLAEDTPDNKQQRSNFSFGPDVRLRLSPRDILLVSGRQAHVEIASEGEDSERLSLETSWRHDISPRSIMTLGLGHDDVEFNDTMDNGGTVNQQQNNDYSSQSANVQLTRRIPSGQINLDIGYSIIDSDLFEDDFTSTTYSLDAVFQSLGGETAFNASRLLTDSSIGLDRGLGGNFGVRDRSGTDGPDTDLDFGSTDATIILRKRVMISHGRDVFSPATKLALALTWDESAEEEGEQAETKSGFRLTLNRFISEELSLELTAAYEEFERSNDIVDFVDKRKRIDFSVTRELNPETSFSCGYGYVDRESEARNDFSSNIVECRIDYRVL